MPFLPKAEAVIPPPDGCYPNFTTAEGCDALNSLTTGAGNTGLGWRSLFLDSTGSFNTGVGGGALVLNNGDSNTAVGAAALLLNTTGMENTGVGTDAMVFNDAGANNTAVGAFALFSNGDSNANTAVGSGALFQNDQTGTAMAGTNTAVGFDALFSNIDGNRNTAVGADALNQSTGSSNTAVGRLAGNAIITGSGNVCIGQGVSGENGVSNRTYIRNVNNDVVSGGGTDTVTVELATGRIGHAVSSRRYKEEIKPMDKASEALYGLQPVSFRYKKEIDRSQNLDYGLVAEDVAEVNQNLAIRNAKGEIESVRYTAVNAMLLNEFLKEHRKVQELESTVASLAATVKEQATQIQKVSARLEMQDPAAKMVVNDP